MPKYYQVIIKENDYQKDHSKEHTYLIEAEDEANAIFDVMDKFYATFKEDELKRIMVSVSKYEEEE